MSLCFMSSKERRNRNNKNIEEGRLVEVKDKLPLTIKEMRLIHDITCLFSKYQDLLVPKLKNKKDRRAWRDGITKGGNILIGRIFNNLVAMEDDSHERTSFRASSKQRNELREVMLKWLDKFGCPDSYREHTADSMVKDVMTLGVVHVRDKSKIFRRGKWRKLLKDMRCEDCKLTCGEDVECNSIEDFLNKLREVIRK